MSFLRLFISILLLMISANVLAQTVPANNDNSFDPLAADQTLDRLAIKLATENLNLKHLQDAINILNQLQQQANNCVNSTSTQLTQINQQLGEFKPSIRQSAQLTAEQKYLQDKSNQLSTQLSNCRFFVLRSQEALTAYNQTVQKLVATELLRSEPNILSNIIALPYASKFAYQNFNGQTFITANGFNLFSYVFSIIVLILLVGGIFISLKIRKLIKAKLTKIERNDHFITQMKLALLDSIKHYVLAFLLLAIFTISINIISISHQEYIALALISSGALAYIIALGLIRFLITPPKSTTTPGLIKMPRYIGKLLTHRLKLLASLCLVALVIYCLFNSQDIPAQITRLGRTVFITLLTLNLISIISLINKLPSLIYHHRIIRYGIAILLILSLLAIVIAEWLGYHHLSTYLLSGISITVIALTIALSIKNFINFIFISFIQSQYAWQKNIRTLLGLKRDEPCHELLLLKIVCYLLIAISFLLVLLNVWGLSHSNFRLLINGLNHGFKLAGFTIVPASIMFAALIFSLLLGVTRIVRTQIIHKTQSQMDQGGREALAAIIGYIGFAIALLLGLLAAGVNFSGLAIIAGALSVGIGFGLQTIVNNFVSGIILLIERPVKPGDRIVVGDTEGYIRKISIRYTQIKTSLRSDVLVPNSDLITKQVTNLTFNDLYSVLNLTINIAYGADPELVKKVLLDVATRHPQVITNQTDYLPQVYFKSFGENSLNFILYCSILDVNQKSVVESDLNFLIEKSLKEVQIEIAWPRRQIKLQAESH